MYSIIFFFFKQKTAYEMRISDWSSDVCSSDLAPERYPAAAALRLAPGSARTDGIGRRAGLRSGDGRGAEGAGQRRRDPHQHQGHDDPHSRRRDGRPYRAGAAGCAGVDMIIPPGPPKVLAAVKPVDFRKGMVGLASLVPDELNRDPFPGDRN